MSATHCLRIQGTIELDQFWPIGNSDADTSKLQLRLNGPVEVRLVGSNRFLPTMAYDGAYVLTGQRADGDGSRKFVIDPRVG